MAQAHLHIISGDGQWVPWSGSGGASGGVSAADALSQPFWGYAGATSGIVDTADVVLKAAAGVGNAVYLTSLQFLNTHATVSTEVVVKSGSTVIWRGYAPAVMKTMSTVTFSPPLRSASNAALNFACITTGTQTYVSAQGTSALTAEQVIAGVTPGEEIFDDLGVLMTADDSSTLYLN